MRGLAGDFNTMPLEDLVGYLVQRRPSGVLTLERVGARKEIWLQNGAVRNATSSDPREYLGQFLINLGHITEEQFNKARETQRETKIFLGKILVMTGIVKEEALQTVLSLKFRETILEAFRWRTGTFSFDAAQTPKGLDGMDLTIDLADVHREAEFRKTAWQAIRSAFPSGRVRLVSNEQNLPEPPRPGSIDARIMELVREGHTIDELGLALHATDFFLYQRLYALYRLEAVAVDETHLGNNAPPAELTPEPNEAEARALLRKAQDSVDAQDWAAAEDEARRAHQLSPSPEAAQLLREAEAKLLEELRASLLAGKAVPRLLVTMEELKAMPLSAPQRYLLSRMDGTRELRSIVGASPIRELDALKVVKHFLDDGVLAI